MEQNWHLLVHFLALGLSLPFVWRRRRGRSEKTWSYCLYNETKLLNLWYVLTSSHSKDDLGMGLFVTPFPFPFPSSPIPMYFPAEYLKKPTTLQLGMSSTTRVLALTNNLLLASLDSENVATLGCPSTWTFLTPLP